MRTEQFDTSTESGARLAKFYSRKDWAGLLRYYCAHEDQTAIEIAIQIIASNSKQKRDRWFILAEALINYPQFIKSLSSLPTISFTKEEFAAIQLIVIHPNIEVLARTNQAPPNSRNRIISEGTAAAELAITMANSLGDQEVEAAVLHKVGYYKLHNDNVPGAIEIFEHSVDLFEKLTNVWPSLHKPKWAGELNNLALAYRQFGKPEKAVRTYVRVLTLYRELCVEDRKEYYPYVGRTFSNLGNAQLTAGKLAEASSSFIHAISIRRELLLGGDTEIKPLLANTISSLGNALMNLGDFDFARNCFAESLELLTDQSEYLDSPSTIVPYQNQVETFRQNLAYASEAVLKLDQYETEFLKSVNSLPFSLDVDDWSALLRHAIVHDDGGCWCRVLRLLSAENLENEPEWRIRLLECRHNFKSEMRFPALNHEAIESLSSSKRSTIKLLELLPAIGRVDEIANNQSNSVICENDISNVKFAAELAESIGDSEMAFFLLQILACGLRSLGKPEIAKTHFQNVVNGFREYAQVAPHLFLRKLAHYLTNFGRCQLELEDHVPAEESFRESLEIHRNLPPSPQTIIDQAIGLGNLGAIVAVREDYVLTQRLCKQGLELIETIDFSEFEQYRVNVDALRKNLAIANERLDDFKSSFPSESLIFERGDWAGLIRLGISLYSETALSLAIGIIQKNVQQDTGKWNNLLSFVNLLIADPNSFELSGFEWDEADWSKEEYLTLSAAKVNPATISCAMGVGFEEDEFLGQSQGQLIEVAITTCLHGAKLAEMLGDPILWWYFTEFAALGMFRSGLYHEACELKLGAVAINRNISQINPEKVHGRLVSALNDLASMYLRAGFLGLAKAAISEAIELLETEHGLELPGEKWISTCLTTLGLVEYESSNFVAGPERVLESPSSMQK